MTSTQMLIYLTLMSLLSASTIGVAIWIGVKSRGKPSRLSFPWWLLVGFVALAGVIHSVMSSSSLIVTVATIAIGGGAALLGGGVAWRLFWPKQSPPNQKQ